MDLMTCLCSTCGATMDCEHCKHTEAMPCISITVNNVAFVDCFFHTCKKEGEWIHISFNQKPRRPE